MKTNPTSGRKFARGYALIIVLGLVGVTLVMLAATMNRTSSVQRMNDRSIQYNVAQNAAEAAVEKAYCRIAYDFQTFGAGDFAANLGVYATNVPNASDSDYFGNFDYYSPSNMSSPGRTYIGFVTNYSGPMPSQYPGLFVISSPVYRIISNVSPKGARYPLTNACQVDVLLALVPITTYAIFYNGLLEFSTCADMTINGRVHSNNKIYTGTSSTLTFNSTVTSSSTLSSPFNNGSGPWTFPGGVFNGSPKFSTNVSSVTLSINMTNTHTFIEMPTTNDAATVSGKQRLYNQAAVILLVSNSTTTAKIQAVQNYGEVAGQDPSPIYITSSNTASALATNFPFLVLTNTFLDQREDKTIKATEIDIGKYASWLSTTSVIFGVGGKYNGTGNYPTILYVADKRTNLASELPAVRLTNGAAPPANNGLGFTVATPGALYVLGTYNQTNSTSSILYSTNTSTGTVPCGLMSDALTILSSSWRDATSFTISQNGASAASQDVVNAAIIAGIVPSTGTNSGQFSGGVHNLPRMLEDWSSSTLWLNTSIVNLYNSTSATNKFVTPGTGSYYKPPTRKFSFDQNFLDPTKQAPGVPTALVPIRFNWTIPPAGKTNYNVIP